MERCEGSSELTREESTLRGTRSGAVWLGRTNPSKSLVLCFRHIGVQLKQSEVLSLPQEREREHARKVRAIITRYREKPAS
jgi:hypothetical protein